jgi:hypothetical protein
MRSAGTSSIPFNVARKWLARTVSDHEFQIFKEVSKVCLASGFRLRNYIFVRKK